MRKNLLYLVAIFATLSLSVKAQDSTCVTINMFDSYGDGGGEVTVGDVTATNDGASSSTEVCVDMSVCNSVVFVATDSWSYENSWSITDADGSVLASGADTDGLFGGCVSACADETADNYNAAADIVDNTLCEYSLVQGCIDETACNYDMAAEQDNGSCEFPAEGFDCEGNCTSGTLINLTAGGGLYANEISWSITLGDSPVWSGVAIGLDQMCLSDGTYLLEMFDSYGDSWNGNQIAMFNDTTGFSEMMDVELTSFLLDGFPSNGPAVDYASLEFYIGPKTGCMDSTAFNFDSTVEVDDGSCVAFLSGCIDPIAENYNPEANQDDASCTYVPGCIDNTAVNYAPGATQDDGSCFYTSCIGTAGVVSLSGGTYPSEMSISISNEGGQVLLGSSILDGAPAGEYDICFTDGVLYTATLLDSYGDGWSGGEFTITSCDGQLLVASGTLLAGAESTIDSISVMSCDSYVFGCADTLADNFDALVSVDNGSCIYLGCTDLAYLEYDASANTDDSTCVTLIVEGCMDEMASNYDSLANFEDGSCVLSVPCDSGLTGMVIYMNDSWGDGWNGNEYTMVSQSGDVVATGGLPSVGFTVTPEGTSGSDTLCVAPGCFAISVAGGSFINEVSWSISTEFNGESIASGGGDNTATSFSLGTDDDCSNLLGCDDIYASNYNADAVANDGSCEYPTSEDCEDAIAMDINSSYSGSFGTQTWFSITLDSAMFVSASAVPAAGFFYPGDVEVHTACDSTDEVLELGVLEAGTYLISCDNSNIFANGDGYILTVNASEIVSGCSDQYADNYNEAANVDDESCLFPCEGISTDLTISTETWANEVYWELLSDIGEILATGGGGSYANNTDYTFPVCLQVGVDYTMNTYDSYGDGWNGSTYSIVAECGEDSLAFTYIAANNNGASPSDLASISDGLYHLESAEVFALPACSDVVSGCLDSTAFNFDPLANVSSGACEAFVYGCMDTTALNFDADANTDTPEDCVLGCDGEYVTVSVVLDFWGSEMYWGLYNSIGDTIVSGGPYGNGLTGDVLESQWCLPLGAYVFEGLDTYGDGWGQGGSFSVTTACDGIDIAHASGTPAGFGAPESFELVSCDDVFPGCNNVNALNYDEAATHDDGSCEYAVPCYQTPVDGAVIDLASVDSIVLSWDVLQPTTPDFYYVFLATDPDDLVGSTVISANNYGTGNPTQWTDYDGLYNLFIDNGYGAGEEFNVYWWVSPIFFNVEGADEIFCGSNEVTLTISAINGCTDSLALNFDDSATLDDGTCIFPCEEGLTLSMNDSYGDGWNGNIITINGMDYTLDGINDDGASSIVCVDDSSSCYTVEWTTGAFLTETSWILMNSSSEVVAEGSAGSGAGSFGDCSYGCTDDSYAEFDASATADDGSCATLLCAGTVVTMDMFDSYGDGWNGNIYVISNANGDVVAEGGITGFVGEASDDLCLEDGCYTMTVDGGLWQTEVSWELGDIASGGAPFNGNFSLNTDCEFAVPGCTDESAVTYDPDANEDDGSCLYEGCTDIDADNFDMDASFDDGSCQYSCDGDQSQVDILITTDTYSSENSFLIVDDQSNDTIFDGTLANQSNTTITTTLCVDNGSYLTFTLFDDYGDGINNFGDGITNGGFSIFVCEESVYENFAFDGYSTSHSFYAACGEVFGCMNSDALNYDMDATEDDGSCVFPCDGVDATVTVMTEVFANEITWSLTNADGNVVAEDMSEELQNGSLYYLDVCLEEGVDYTFNMYDSYGDGWNGAGFYVDADCELASGTLDALNDDGSAGSVSFTASCGGDTTGPVGDCVVPSEWAVTITGSNHTILIPEEALIMMDDMDMAADFVGVFFTNSDGEPQCAGYAEITGETVQIAAMGDDTTTDEVDGLLTGEPLVWGMFDCATGEMLAATATYTNGPDTYTANGLTFVESITSVPDGPESQVIDLPSGWSMFSSYMIADDMNMMSMLSPIVDNVIIAKDNAGNAYLVEYDFNGIGDCIVGQGYQIKTVDEASIEVTGAYAFPEEHIINLTAGWNLVGYLRTESANAAAVLADINDAGNLVIAKDYAGNAYLPEFDFNGIGDMHPGQGYQLKTNEVDVLVYKANDDPYRLSYLETTVNNLSHFNKVVSTDNNMTVVIEDIAWDVVPTEGSEIAAFDKEGTMIGSAIYTSPVTVLTVWGDDAMTASKEAAIVSEVVSFQVWTAGELNHFTVSEWTQGSSSYAVDAINIASTIETSSSTSVNASERVLVKVVNVLGQEVNMNDEAFKGEVLFHIYDDGTVEKTVR